MRTNYVLIDYENVQPQDLALLNGHPFKVFVLVGTNQTKIPTEFADALQARGENGRYVRINGNGRNALDFHIAFHLGELAAKDPEGFYHVISKDTGFDPLLGYLKARGIHAQRSGRYAYPGPLWPKHERREVGADRQELAEPGVGPPPQT
jgi:hypothetical protein